MPPLVFDFADIASRLRRDDFYTPTPKPTVDLTLPPCPRCNSREVKTAILVGRGDWFCNACNWYFS